MRNPISPHWQTFTIDELAQFGHLTKSGAKTKGPSGVGVWSAPTIDAEKWILYARTGDTYSWRGRDEIFH
jgi:hypothetical protein